MGKVKKDDETKTSVKDTSSKSKNDNTKIVKNQQKKSAPKQKKVDKDTLMNTPKEKDSGVKLMPHDAETLRVFSLKKMNFKDMTGNQKTTLIVLCLFLGLFIISFALPTIASLLDGTNIGNLRFANSGEEEPEENPDDAFALEGDYITLGNNAYINVEGIKFYNFTKSSGYKLVYNYVSTKNIEDVKALKIYIEFYNNTKTLINRFAFTTDTNTLTEGVQGLNQITMSSNNFNKAYYVRVKVITDAIVEDLPDEEEPNEDETENSNGTTSGGTSNGSSGNTEENNNTDKSKLMICTRNDIDGSLKINETMNVTLKNGEVTKYSVTYKITSMISGPPKNYSTYYKKMLKKYKNVIKSYVYEADIFDEGTSATLTYTAVLKDYTFVEIDEKDYDKYDKDFIKKYLKNKPPYELEIEKESTRAQAKAQLETLEWDCD